MRKFFTILLLSIQIFTLCGYHFIFNYFEQRADNSLVKKLDSNNYSESQLITIKILLHIPYINNSDNFERCDGTIKLNGVFYNYVKRKLSNDTLIIECIANNEKNKICEANIEYKKLAGNMQSSSNNDKPLSALLRLFFSDNDHLDNESKLASLSFNNVPLAPTNARINAHPFLSSALQPPEFSEA